MRSPDEDDAPTDLSPLTAYQASGVADRVIGGVMVRIAESISVAHDVAREMARDEDTPAPVLADVSRLWYPGIAAAALVFLVAGLTVTRLPDAGTTRAPRAEAQLLEWARSGHTPTNGDLVAAFRPAAR